MCGLIGYNGIYKASWYVQEGLKHLEYRGYDSYGSAFLLEQEIYIHKNVGFVKLNYSSYLNKFAKNSSCGIGHVRWATNGVVNKINAHPHMGGRNIVLVHNGIIQNTDYLKRKIGNYQIKSQTDTEILAHYLDLNRNSLSKAIKNVDGDFAVLFLIKGQNSIFAICRNVPIYLANTKEGNILASSANVFDEILENYEYTRLADGKLIKISKQRMPAIAWIPKTGKKTEITDEEKFNGYITLREIKKQEEVIKTFQPKSLALNKKKKLIFINLPSANLMYS